MRFLPIPLILLLALSPAAGSKLEPGRVIVIGLDGVSMKLAEPLIAEGRMPNLAKLAAWGAWGVLRSELPSLSPRVWTTIATGMDPLRHGISGWVFKDAEGEVHLFESRHRRGAALWNIASAAGLKVATVNWLMTYPPEVIDGVVVTDHALPEEAATRRRFGTRFAKLAHDRGLDDPGLASAPTVLPASWAERLVPQMGSLEPLTFPNPFDTNEGLKEVALRLELSHFYWNDQRAARVAIALNDQLKPDLLMVLMQGVDRVSHSLWGTLRPETAPGLSEAKRQAGSDAMRGYYEIADSLVGKLIEHYTPSDLVIVVSDHGFEHVEGKGILPWGGVHETEDSTDGIVFMRGRQIPRGHRIEGLTVNDITPTILAWLGLPVARDMKGTPAPFLKRRIGWTDTYDDIDIQRIGEGGSKVEPLIIEQLESLGYIDAD